MKSLTRLSGAGLIGLALFAGLPTTSYAQVDLPTANCGATSTANNCLIFNDFTVYSLGLLGDYQKNFSLFQGYDFTYKPNEAIVTIIDGAGQGTAAQGTGMGIDDPFRAMNSSKVDNLRFLMAGDSITTGGSTIPSDPTGTGTWDNRLSGSLTVNNSDTFTQQEVFGTKPYSQFVGGKTDPCYINMNTAGCIQSWDANIVDLRAALDGQAMVVMFNNNETGDRGTLAGQDLLTWAQVTLLGDNGEKKVFTLSGDPLTQFPQQWQAQTTGVDDILPTDDDYWAYVHSEICVSAGTGAVFLGPCNSPLVPFTDGKTVNQSLGADQAGFAVYNQELSDLINDPNSVYKYLSLDVRFSHLNNGGDNLWIMGADFDNKVPEPGTLALAGLALLACGAIRRRGATSMV